MVWAGGGAINEHHLLPLVIHCLDVLAPAAADHQGIYLVMPTGGVDSQALRKLLLESFESRPRLCRSFCIWDADSRCYRESGGLQS